jgi:hypothetical protein
MFGAIRIRGHAYFNKIDVVYKSQATMGQLDVADTLLPESRSGF